MSLLWQILRLQTIRKGEKRWVGTTDSDRNVRLQMGLPPVAKNSLEQSLRSWLCARKFFEERVPASAARTISAVREHVSAVGRTDGEKHERNETF